MSVSRITNLMMSNTVVSEIDTSEQALDTTEEQLSTSLSINEPSDNPVGAGLAVQLNGQLSQFSAYTDNVSVASSWNSSATTAMTTLQQDVSRVQELVTDAGNGTESQSDLNDISDEITQIQASIQSTLSTQYNGQGIFTGTAANNAAVSMTVSPGTSVTVTADLSGLMNGTGGATGLLDTLNQIQSDLTGTSQGGMTPDASNLNGSDLTNLASNLDALGQSQIEVGTAQDQIQMASTSLQSLTTSTTSELGDDQNVNMATAETNYNDEEAAFEAALKAGSDIVQESLMDFLGTSS
jgi:flagellar hook-associated protein 3 FlgL